MTVTQTLNSVYEESLLKPAQPACLVVLPLLVSSSVCATLLDTHLFQCWTKLILGNITFTQTCHFTSPTQIYRVYTCDSFLTLLVTSASFCFEIFVVEMTNKQWHVIISHLATSFTITYLMGTQLQHPQNVNKKHQSHCDCSSAEKTLNQYILCYSGILGQSLVQRQP